MQTHEYTEAATRFSLIELDGVPPAAPSAVASPAPNGLDAAAVSNDGEINMAAARLAEREAALANEHGFAVRGVNDGTFYSAGTKLWGVGEAALAAYAEAYEKLPTLGRAAEAHAATIAAERREERVERIAGYRIDADGRLRGLARDDDGQVAFGPRAIDLAEQGFKQLVQLAPEGTGCKTNVNRWLARPAADRDARFRLRARHGRREVFAVFPHSDRGYVPFDGDRVLFEAAQIAPELKCDLDYDELTTRLRARCVAQAPIDIPAFTGVGRVHRIGFDLISADNGTSTIQCRSFLIRVRCKNASLVNHAGRQSRFRHVGTFEGLRTSIAAALETAARTVDAMKRLWQDAATAHYADEVSGLRLSPTEAITRLVATGHVPTGGLTRDAAIDAYLAAFRAENSPATAMGILMAIQRAAHESSWRTRWAGEEVEEAASRLLHAQVWALPEAADANPGEP